MRRVVVMVAIASSPVNRRKGPSNPWPIRSAISSHTAGGRRVIVFTIITNSGHEVAGKVKEPAHRSSPLFISMLSHIFNGASGSDLSVFGNYFFVTFFIDRKGECFLE